MTALALSSLVFAAGCGSDDSARSETAAADSAPSEPQEISVRETSITSKAYVRQAAAICTKAGQEMIAQLSSFAPIGNEDEPAAFDSFNDSVLVPIVEGELVALEKLGAPQGESKEVEEILRAMASGIEEARAGTVSSLEQFGLGFAEFDRRVRGYGMNGCAFSLSQAIN